MSLLIVKNLWYTKKPLNNIVAVIHRSFSSSRSRRFIDITLNIIRSFYFVQVKPVKHGQTKVDSAVFYYRAKESPCIRHPA